MSHSAARQFTARAALLLSAAAFGCSDGTAVNGTRQLGALRPDITGILSGPDTVRAGARVSFVVTTAGSNCTRPAGASVRALDVLPAGSTPPASRILIEPYDFVPDYCGPREIISIPRTVSFRVPPRTGALEIVVRGRSRFGGLDTLEIRDTVVIVP